MTREETTALLGVLKTAYPGRFMVGETQVALWSEMLVDLTIAEALDAVQAFIAESPHPPTISDIRVRAAERALGAPAWEVAWGEVQRAIGSTGRYRAPKFSHDAIAAAVDVMGWQPLCNALEEDIPTLRAQFRDAYANLRRRAVAQANVGRLESARRAAPRLGAPVPIGAVLPLKESK